MTSSPSPSTESQCSDVVTDAANLSKNKDLSSEHMEDDEEEDEEGDMDFNPFLKEPPSLEPSSSLSSDIEEFNADVDSAQNHSPVKNTEHSQATVTQAAESLSNKDNEPNIATSDSRKPILDSDDEDAIWRRTRARYSLVGSTLDELETFLQETDDEDDLHNIDDEQEYRKFLAAVLQDGDANSGAFQETENIDEDEDNDADFELELEEALGSDIDENLQIVSQERETRQKKRQKTDFHKKKISANNNNNRPLRPILPYAPPYMFQNMSSRKEYTTPFTPHQIGQLHCLMYEHVQLLLQVFSLSVLEPSRQHIATQVKSLLLEIVHKRDQVLASQRVPYPCYCFSLPYIQSTVNFSFSSESEEGSFMWVPFVSENVLSVIDVAPLNLVGNYLDDVSNAVHEHQRRQLEVTYEATVDKECLFPFSNFPPEGDSDPSTVSSSASNDQKSKKTIAGALVERSQKQSIALVPKEIARLALRFFPLFNPALFPHKPPLASIASRFLFTDAEDGLLARGLMEYNTNWKEIQKHFLPCKSPHQIFVRQKNRSCSRAPENPIKAVKRWKTSPLTPQEKARIEEGLKVFKLDWMAVWQYMVPYRDPTLLARQYRTAVGNQKSYKIDELKKAKRRLYESNRRKIKLQGPRFQSTVAGQSGEGWSTEEDANPSFSRDKENCSTDNAPGEINSEDDGGNNEDEAYVHEAFLSDWRPGNQPVTLFPHEKLPNYPRLVNYHPQNPISRPEIHLPPYQSSRSKGSRVVKLAPDLPPVNLPPTVRIMSQSAFTKYNEASSKAVAVTPLTHPRTSQLDEQNTGKGDSDLQMHPLLFQDNGDGSLPYYPLNPSVGSSSSFDFFPNKLNLFRYSHQEKHTVNFFNNLKSKELSSSGVEFHPLLQRTDDGIGDSSVATPQPPTESSTPRRRVPRSPNELDLDIRLSSSARNRDSRTIETQQRSGVQEQDAVLPEENGNGNGPDSGVGNDEIVMEQEELSDSEDEEIAESVEFECEEMTDSEGEGGSDSDHAENVQNEDLQDDVLAKGSKSDVAIEEPRSLLGLSLNPKLPVTRNSRSSKNTTLPLATPPQVKKPRKRAQKLDPNPR
ncbi:hypothetical protein L2E82_40271 [Cichorium intybus]|uniref:Uncharacterized protein n=1 Tax=Cichorium intybus TaxID=13427 RepID=A0ACB9AKX4_CICIN|nr:hypothetical protein L2E82_40271 [Cichorium intybus]